jgi:demethylmenaquinone methyltransferase/2-methoxy-6-polyprenyl-1,4-benzoquinol methylase
VNSEHRKKSLFFDRLAEEWAGHGYDTGEVHRVIELIERSGIQPGWRILEPGCGPGLITPLIADRVGFDGRVLALDISPVMVKHCLKRTEELRQVLVEHGAIEDLEGHRGEFDLVFCFNSFPHFCDRDRALQVAAECLKPCGKLVIAHSNSRQRVNEIHMRAGGPVKRDLLPKPVALRKLVESHGFKVIELYDGHDSFFLSAEKR